MNKLCYTVTKLSLQGAGLAAKAKRRSAHRKKRLRRPLPGMLLFQDGSTHRWIAALGRVMISARARCPSPALSARSEIPRRSDHRRRCPGRRLFWSRSSGEECGRVPRGCGRP
jgi:hypothetical protein